MENATHPTFGDGKICYIEIPAKDINVSSSFYHTVFGWRIRKKSETHISFDDGVGEVSGVWVTGRSAATDPAIVIHIMVFDMEKAIAAVIANGGKIVEPVGKHLPDITAKFSDPAGNVFGLYQHGK